jgi:putative ABC transport system substrate-binding protein
MRRREFITLLGGGTWAQLIPWQVARAETRKRPLVVWVSVFPPPSNNHLKFVDSFRQGMRERGYTEDRDFELVSRFGDGHFENASILAQEIVQLKPDVIVAPATLEAVAAKKATSTIPIVCPALADAVHLGLIASEALPGGNVTGVAPYIAGLPAKQIDLAIEMFPGMSRIGILTNQEDPKAPPQLKELEAAGLAKNAKIITGNVSRPGDIENALRVLAREQVDVVIVLQTGLLLVNGRQIAASALGMGLSTLYGYREHVVAGGLISYGVDLSWCYRRAAYFVDRILHGTPPAHLPIEFPTQFSLSINLKTAKALGIAVPPMLIARADEVIE